MQVSIRIDRDISLTGSLSLDKLERDKEQPAVEKRRRRRKNARAGARRGFTWRDKFRYARPRKRYT